MPMYLEASLSRVKIGRVTNGLLGGNTVIAANSNVQLVAMSVKMLTMR